MPSRLNDWLDRIQTRHPPDIKLGLERCQTVWARMGCPRPAPHVFVVAGTNGKGSTVAGIEAGLRALGHRVGCYTSPHLLRYNERIRIDGKDADDEAIIAGFEAVEAALGDTHLTYFEFGTLAAFAAISRAGLDFAVLEVGLGGRLDAVNIVDADVAIITPIGMDHQDYLGADRESVGREKAGIMRSDGTVVCSDREPPDSVFSAAAELGARLIRIGADFDVSSDPSVPGEGRWRYFFADLSASLAIAMYGAHQADNLAAAVTAILLCEPSARSKLQEVATAVGRCRVRGRLERICDAPEVIVDVGHNPLAARIIRDFLESRNVPACRVVLGMYRDKDAEGVVDVLGDLVSDWYCAGIEGSRGQTGLELAKRVRHAAPDARVIEFDRVDNALDAAIGDVGEDGLVVAFGSFMTAGQAITHLQGPN